MTLLRVVLYARLSTQGGHAKPHVLLAAFALVLSCTQCTRPAQQSKIARDLSPMATQPAQQRSSITRGETGFDYYEFRRPDLGTKVSNTYRNADDWWLFVENVNFDVREIGSIAEDGLILDGPLKGNYQISLNPKKFLHLMTPERARQGFR